jgi:hypothetical protein
VRREAEGLAGDPLDTRALLIRSSNEDPSISHHQNRLILCRRPNVVKDCKRHVAHVAPLAFRHLHVDPKCVRKLPRLKRVALFKAVDKNLESGDHSGTICRDDFTSRESFPAIMSSFQSEPG